MDDAVGAGDTSRAMGRWPELALAAAAVAMIANGVLLAAAWPDGDIPWAVGQLIVLAASVVVRSRRPDLAVSAWIALSVFPAALGELTTTALSGLLDHGGSDLAIAWTAAIGHVAGALAGVITLHILATYPGDQRAVGWERRVLQIAWALVVVPIAALMAAETVPIPPYVGDGQEIDNPLRLLPSSSSAVVDVVTGATPLLMLGGVAILVAHYRRADLLTRRQMRWLLVPLPLVPLGIVLNIVLADSGQVILWIFWLALLTAIPVAGAIGILQPARWDPDRVLRRSLVYGVLWTVIVATLIGAAALAGTTAERYVPVAWAVVVAIGVSLAFQPLRRRLETTASRWLFGERVDHSSVITNLGATLAETFDLERLLPRMVDALEEGLQLTWAHVKLSGVADGRAPDEPAVVVPIELDDERLGVVECGEKRDGQWTDDDRAVVATFARQAALAVRNVRLTEQTARYAAAMELSRARIARAAESERRRIERNIHDGIQQDLVVLIAMAGRLQGEPDHTVMSAGMVDLRRRLERVLGDLRDLASGIYPSVLSDQGVLPAVEALVATHPDPIRLRADPDLRSVRLPEGIEGAAYFTIAEALTNSLKHADATVVDITLTRSNGSLQIEVADDGVGFDRSACVVGSGLEGLADRLDALGGTFEIDTGVGCGTVVHATLSITERTEA